MRSDAIPIAATPNPCASAICCALSSPFTSPVACPPIRRPSTSSICFQEDVF
ncbi:hypothetical protein B0H10DRAFT_2014479 [Mycena sp. CBHHK59/15]|nr:hypothetical protein B0H10DRAFT_2120333 [Mycena sp. CBHHK59/15]KAJ6596547.1 hypothetical protein B0H10DRAFT_2088769 [Mycena sp. CBHHK59/15]KAJ6622374.1 hypothetical protein B0H10DRAFT_2014479 [Mycena sp. CBHHK59/15]